MSSASRTQTWLLRAYPKSYRERRGDEIVATLIATETHGGSHSIREAASILSHASGLRIRQFRPVTLVIVFTLLGAGLGAGVSVLESRTSYVAEARLVPAPASFSEMLAAPRPTALLARLNQLLSQHQTMHQLLEPLGIPSPYCSGKLSEEAVVVACTSDDAQRAGAAVNVVTKRFARTMIAARVARDAQRLTDLASVRATAAAELLLLRHQMAHVSRMSPNYSIDRSRVISITRAADAALATERELVGGMGGVGPGFGVVGVTTRQEAALPVSAVVIGGSAGLLLGALLVVARGRRRPPAQLASS
jgi:hypothetical protein